jgi:hypothetical protein
MEVMKYLVTNPYHKVDIDVLDRMWEFANHIQGPETIREVAMELIDSVAAELHVRIQSFFQISISSRHCSLLLQPPRNSPPSSQPSVSASINPQPQDLAIALMMLEGDKYARIIPGDYISYLRRPEENNSIGAARKTNDLIIKWVKHSVLREDTLYQRKQVLTFFVNTAVVTLSS